MPTQDAGACVFTALQRGRPGSEGPAHNSIVKHQAWPQRSQATRRRAGCTAAQRAHTRFLQLGSTADR